MADLDIKSRQEAQLPQRSSASAAHIEGAKPSSPLPLPPLATPIIVDGQTPSKFRYTLINNFQINPIDRPLLLTINCVDLL